MGKHVINSIIFNNVRYDVVDAKARKLCNGCAFNRNGNCYLSLNLLCEKLVGDDKIFKISNKKFEV